MNIISYLKETKTEMRHVNWPTQKQAVFYTIVVIILALLVSFFLGFFDFGLTFLLGRFII